MKLRHFRDGRAIRFASVLTMLLFLHDLFQPTVAWALTGGPGQDDISRFVPDHVSSFVQPFSGDFNYSIPLLDVLGADDSGYPITLGYNSGVGVEQEASWVGYGWSLNVGAVNRVKQGYADDHRDVDVLTHNRVRWNQTGFLNFSADLFPELFSSDILKTLGVGATANLGVRVNSHKGLSVVAGANLASLGGFSTLSFGIDGGSGSFDHKIDPGAALNFSGRSLLGLANTDTRAKEVGVFYAAQSLDYASSAASSHWSSFINRTGGSNQRSWVARPYEGAIASFHTTVEVNPTQLPIGNELGITAMYTVQNPVNELNDHAFGYMYSGDANPEERNDLMDYYLENDANYDKRDRTLPIPFSNVDRWNVSGDRIGGGFRLYHNKVGQFHPAHRESVTGIGNLTLPEIAAGLNSGTGVKVGGGAHTLALKDWTEPGDASSESWQFRSPSEGDEAVFFMFDGDMGGNLMYDDNDQPIQAQLFEENGTAGQRDYSLVMNHLPNQLQAATPDLNAASSRVGRSSYIGFNTNFTMENDAANGKGLSRYSRRLPTEQHINRNAGVEDGIGEFSFKSGDGRNFTYGLPVYARDECDLQFGLDGVAHSLDAGDRKRAYLDPAEGITKDNAKVLTGQEIGTPYATSFLLTEVTTNDYVDVTLNGPTADDFGGYTTFDYRRTYGTDDKAEGALSEWFKWRAPYNGLNFQRGSFSDPKDDMGTVSYGYKEQYYLFKVETKSHVAYFITNATDEVVVAPNSETLTFQGSGEIRQDGLSAPEDEQDAMSNSQAQGSKALERLERIELYAKDADGLPAQLLERVYFEYDYSMMEGTNGGDVISGLPNQSSLNNTNNGKLTLRRIWKEYGDVTEAGIEPYRFYYHYPQNSTEWNGLTNDQKKHIPQADYPVEYAAFENYGLGLLQNPAYSPLDADRWGNHMQNYGDPNSNMGRAARYLPYTNQDPADDFDPAAWHLKVIKEPSGGEVHVQYEQHEYRYVQDAPAMAMVSLRPDLSTDVFYNLNDGSQITWVPFGAKNRNKYYLDLEDVGYDELSVEEQEAWFQQIKGEFTGEHAESIYFKFLYLLRGVNLLNDADIDDCNVEYIEGFAAVNSVGRDNDGIYIKLGKTSGLDPTNTASIELPYQACYNFYETNRQGGYTDGTCATIGDFFAGETEPGDMIYKMLAQFGSLLTPDRLEICTEVSFDQSYLRIPMYVGKKGGGVRVKRLLQYDRGIDGPPTLYGKEYQYEVEDELTELPVSSGVATNEPGTGKEESGLYVHLPDLTLEQNSLGRLVYGREINQTVGILGESLLPGASIGYSHIEAHDINQGINSTGYLVREFYTAKDYPFSMNHKETGKAPTVQHTTMLEEADWLPAYTGLVDFVRNNLWITQGFSFSLNDMHGKRKREAFYAAGGTVATAEEQWTYYEPGELLPMLHEAGADPVDEFWGVQQEVVMERRSLDDVTITADVELDFSLGIFAPIPIPFVSLFPYVDNLQSKLSTHVTSKVTRYPAIMKEHLVNSYGSVSHQTFKGFDAATGEPVINEIYDGLNGLHLMGSQTPHNGTTTTAHYPAHQDYGGMGQKALTQGLVIDEIGISSQCAVVFHKRYDSQYPIPHYLAAEFIGNGGCSGEGPCDALKLFNVGDLLEVRKDVVTKAYYTVYGVNGTSVQLGPSDHYQPNAPTDDWDNVTIRIVKSGRSNQLQETTGYLVTYGDKRTPTEINPTTDWAPRLQLAQLLTTTASGGGGILMENDLPANLTYKPYAQICDLIDDFGDQLDGSAPPDLSNCDVCIEDNPGFLLVFDVEISPVAEAFCEIDNDYPGGPLAYVVKLKVPQGTQFEIDPRTGQLQYRLPNNDCEAFGTCIQLCPDGHVSSQLDGVLAASVRTYHSTWLNTSIPHPSIDINSNRVESGQLGKWRLKAQYRYHTPRVPSTSNVYDDAGTMEDFIEFDREGSLDPRWVRTAWVTNYSPNGKVERSFNEQGVATVTKHDYDHQLPVLTAANSSMRNAEHYSFEVLDNGLFNKFLPQPPNTLWAHNVAHTGQHSLALPVQQGNAAFEALPIVVDPQLQVHGYHLRVWLRETGTINNHLQGQFEATFTEEPGVRVKMEAVANTGEWTLYEATVDLGAISNSTVLHPRLEWSNWAQGIWIDDLRGQPTNSEMISWIYDPVTKIRTAELGDQNFAIFFDYDVRLLPIRKSIETENGRKLIREETVHRPIIDRDEWY